jgi:hypothetical protein
MKILFLKSWKKIKKGACLDLVDIIQAPLNGKMVNFAVVKQDDSDITFKVPMNIVEIVTSPEVFYEGFKASSKVRSD